MYTNNKTIRFYHVIKLNKVGQCPSPRQTLVSVLGAISLPVINFRLGKVCFILGVGEGLRFTGKGHQKAKMEPLGRVNPYYKRR